MPGKPINPMKISKNTLLVKAGVASLLSLMFPRLSPAVENFESLQVVETVLPAYPMQMTYEAVYEGAAQVIVHVNEMGELEDVYLAAYTHPEFGRLAEEYIKKWTFKPAKMNGEPLSVIKPFDFKFEDRRGVFALGIMEAAASKLNFMQHADSKRIYSPSELDKIPTPIQMTKPLFPEEFKGKDVQGSATVLFYIDEEGIPRMPHVTEYSHESFGITSLMAVKDWKFEPPMVRRKPVAILARQVFNFSEKGE